MSRSSHLVAAISVLILSAGLSLAQVPAKAVILEVWLPEHVTFKLDARVALFKGYLMDGDQTYSDYKKFRTSAKIVGYGEVKDPQPPDPQK